MCDAKPRRTRAAGPRMAVRPHAQGLELVHGIVDRLPESRRNSGQQDADRRTLIRDEGVLHDWTPLPGTQHGLAALLEQVSALGGQLETKSIANGFELLARIPDGQ